MRVLFFGLENGGSAVPVAGDQHKIANKVGFGPFDEQECQKRATALIVSRRVFAPAIRDLLPSEGR